MASSTKLEDLPTELLDLIANEKLDIDDAEKLRQASKLFRDVVDMKKEKWKCVNYIRNANDLSERCLKEDFSKEEKICQRKHNLCGPLNVKAFVKQGTNVVTVPYGTTWVGKYTFSDINIDKFEVVLPKTVKNIDSGALEKNHSVIKVFAPGIEKVQYSAFEKCTNLEVFHAPQCQNIGEFAFANCKNLRDFKAPQAKILGQGLFANCGKIQTFEFPQLLIIGESAFYYCVELKEFKNGPVLKEIGDFAFSSCENLETLYFPQAQYIGKAAFAFCSKLRQITISKNTKMAEAALLFAGDSLYKKTGGIEIIYIEDLLQTAVSDDGYTFLTKFFEAMSFF